MLKSKKYSHVDIVIIQKKTNDDIHQKTRDVLLECLNSLKFSFEILTLDDIRLKQIAYFIPSEMHTGLSPKQKLVIALGGDGTLLHASHYVGGDVRLLGINSAPATSKGYLCALMPTQIFESLPLLIAQQERFKKIQRLQLEKKSVPLCLNDVLICHEHPAGTTRTVLTLTNRHTNTVEFSQMIYSSGIWVSTVAGQTAAVSSYGFEKEDEESDMIFAAIREPYFPKNEKKYPATFFFHGTEKQLSLVSKMSSGLICVDGHDSCVHFDAGETLVFQTPLEGILKLIL